MNSRLVKLILFWNAVLTALLLGSLLVNANFAMAANDPPVKVFTATLDHAGGVDGGATTTNAALTSAATWTQLVSVNIDFGAQTHVHHCVAIGSADVINPFSGTSNTYRFDLTLDSTTSDADTGTGRVVNFYTSSSSVSAQNVTTNRIFYNVPNQQHTIRMMGQKFAGAMNTNVTDASISVICTKVLQ